MLAWTPQPAVDTLGENSSGRHRGIEGGEESRVRKTRRSKTIKWWETENKDRVSECVCTRVCVYMCVCACVFKRDQYGGCCTRQKNQMDEKKEKKRVKRHERQQRCSVLMHLEGSSLQSERLFTVNRVSGGPPGQGRDPR